MDIARSGLFPIVGAGFSATRQQTSPNAPLTTTGMVKQLFPTAFISSPRPRDWRRAGRRRRLFDGMSMTCHLEHGSRASSDMGLEGHFMFKSLLE